MKAALKWTLRIVGGMVGLGAITVGVWLVIAGPVTVGRIMRYGDTDIDDWSHYPGRRLMPVDDPYRFAQGEAGLPLASDVLADYGHDGDLARIVAANDTIAFLVIRGDSILFERYLQDHGAASLSQLFSVSKSVTSALVGLAIEDGYLAGVDQPITDFVPELADADFDVVTIEHLLTMTSGSAYRENDNPFGEHVILNYTPRLEQRILAFQMADAPGEVFRYKSGDNALLALALTRALGDETITAYAQRRLWAPLGMEDPGVWTIDHAGDGLEKTWCCLATSARDLAKFGRLYLNQGTWEGTQVLSAEWVARSAQPQVPAAAWPDEYVAVGWRNYGYQWWLASEADGDYFALGKDGQFLYVNPRHDVVIVRLGWSTGDLATSRWVALFQALAREVE